MNRSQLVGVVLALSAALAVWGATSEGMVYPPRDAPTYVASAQSLAVGDGYRTPFGDPGKEVRYDTLGSPVVDFPPGYPLALSIGVLAGLEPSLSARLGASLMAAVIVVLVFTLARRRGIGVLGSSIAAAAAAGITIPESLAPQSEPLYGVFVVGALWASATFIRSQRWAALGVALVLATAAVSVRTVGLALVASLMLLIWLVGKGARRRWLSAGVVGIVGIMPFLLSIGAGDRTLTWHPMDLSDLKIFASAVAGWLVPPVATPAIRLFLLVAGLIVVAIWLVRSERIPATSRQPSDDQLPRWVPGVLSAVAHLGLLVVTILFLDSQTTLSSRLIYPIALSLLVGGVELYAEPSGPSAVHRVARALPVLACAAVVAGMWTSTSEALTVIEGERHFASDQFVTGETLGLTIARGESYPIVSNVPDGLWVAGLDHAHTLPFVVDPLSELSNARIDEEVGDLAEVLEESDGLVFFHRTHERSYLMDEESVREIAPCVVSDDGESVLLVSARHLLCDRLDS